jgi:hypothetical protein
MFLRLHPRNSGTSVWTAWFSPGTMKFAKIICIARIRKVPVASAMASVEAAYLRFNYYAVT